MRCVVRLAAAGSALVAALSLAACDQPAPKLTIQTGSVSEQVSPTTYAFDSTHTRAYRPSLPEITAAFDGRVLIDVPRKVAKAGWRVSAISVSDKTGKVSSLGTASDVADRHTFRIASNANNGNPFIVRVEQLRHGSPDGSVWGFLVKVDANT